MINVLMPRLSDTMTEGTIASWRKQVGDTITAGEVIVEIETDKALMEQEAYESGTLIEILVGEGQLAPIGTPIARIDDGSDPVAAGEAIEIVEVSGAAAPTARGDAEKASGTPEPRLLASPLVRKLARERGIDLAPIQGSGPGGRIVRADLEAQNIPASSVTIDRADAAKEMTAVSAVKTEGEAETFGQSVPSTGASLAKSIHGTSNEAAIVPFDSIRQAIASRLTESATTIPSFAVTSSADVTELLELRQALNEALEARGVKLSVNDLIVRAVSLALRAHPGINASYSPENAGATVLHSEVHIGIAMASAAGLVVPVIRNVDRQSVSAIAEVAKELSLRADDRRLSPAEMSGGTFTVSNLGMFGVDHFDAIINPPQGAILAVGAARDQLQLRGDAAVLRKRMSFTLTSDHRIIDGALAARFLRELTALIEAPMRVIA